MIAKEKLPIYLLIIAMTFVCFFYFWNLGSLPITAYDESIYGQVTRDTLASGQIMTLKNFDNNWFEKPPLYFWLSMPMVKTFGDNELAHRLISSIFAVLSVLLTYLLVKKISNKPYLALLSAFILAINPFFYITSRQVRLDTPLTALMLLSLYFLVLGWRRQKFLIYILPVIGLGFLMKSLAVLVAIPILIIFSFFYKKWNWLKNKWFWYGLPISLLIVLPWHIHQYIVWGPTFFQKYIGWNIITRVSGGFGVTDKVDHLAYFKKLWMFTQPWWQIFLPAVIIFFGGMRFIKSKNHNRLFWASLCSVIFVILFYSLSKTKISTYLIPMYPYMSIVIGLGFYSLWQISKNKIIKIIYLLIFAALFVYSMMLSSGYNDKILRTLHFYLDSDLKEIGQIVDRDAYPNSKFYYLSGPMPDVVSYYSKKKTNWVKISEKNQINIPANSYLLLLQNDFVPLFTVNGKDIKPEYQNMHLRYIQNGLMLLYSEDAFSIQL